MNARDGIIIGGVRHILVANPYRHYPCRCCSLADVCKTPICKDVFDNDEAHFEREGAS